MPEAGAFYGEPQAGRLPAHRRGGGNEEDLPPLAPSGHRENLNEHSKALFDAHGALPTKGQADTARFALGAVLVYQLALLHRYHERHLDTNIGLKAFLRAA